MKREPDTEISLLAFAGAHEMVECMPLEEIDDAIRFVELLEHGVMGPARAARWRWRIMARWAEFHRKPDTAETVPDSRPERTVVPMRRTGS